MGVPYLVRDLPDTELQDDGLVIVTVGGVNIEFAATISVYRAFIERERAKIAAWDQGHRDGAGAQIVQLTQRGPMFLREDHCEG